MVVMVIKKIISIIICLLINLNLFYAFAADDNFSNKSYRQYINDQNQLSSPVLSVTIPADTHASADSAVEKLTDFEEDTGTCIKTPETGFVQWDFELPAEGFYNIAVKYYPIKGKNSSIIRKILINGEIANRESENIILPRIWKNAEEITRDKNDNDIRPAQIEAACWNVETLKDSMGYYGDLKFYFKEGVNSIRLESVREPLVIKEIIIYNSPKPPSYKELKIEYDKNNYEDAVGHIELIQGENAVLKSNSMLYPIYDRSSPATMFSDSSKIRLNTIGAERWQDANQWLTWDFEVPSDGLYKIAIKARQNINNGLISSRKLYIDGQIPFEEAGNLAFPYNTKFQMYSFGENGGYDYCLSKGKHTIKLEVSLGSMAELIGKAQNLLSELSVIYREILVITGTQPDIYRDYQFGKQIPNTIEKLKKQSTELKNLYDEILNITGQNGQSAQIFNELYMQTDSMANSEKQLAKKFQSFEMNIDALGAWIIASSNQPLEIDYMAVYSKEQTLPKSEGSFYEKLIYSVKSFFNSFLQDYSSIGEQESNAVKVWVGSGATGGRDQASALSRLITGDFTSRTNIKVNLQLVSMGALLPATLANQGPDIALSLGGSEPVNYAIRNAVIDLTVFDDFDEIKKRFMPEALTQLTFNNKTYGLPETQTWNMLFYRKDILTALGIEIPKTFDDVINIIPELQKNQMTFGLPPAIGDAVGLSLPTYGMLLMQNGGSFYNEDGSLSMLDSKQAVDTFYKYTDFYSSYQLPVQYDFINRFRVGSVPIGISDMSTYNMLSVFAPGINGLWGFSEVPGTLGANGEIDKSVISNISASIIMEKSEKKQEAWEFLKWWTDAPAQISYGRELESIMGSAARYPSANVEAFGQMPWNISDFKALTAQREWAKGMPEVPGGYFTSRHIDFAFRRVINANKKTDPGEALIDASKEINIEIQSRRKEFGLN